ncbi:cytidine deaminase [Pseudoalteromonas sp. SCSIO_11900]|uniref:anti-phage dCTP deaminase n=1 Tax=Pseudoalteromonas sp. SCSIO_11900 TaxID=1461766 RepID=UPI000448D774|nr:anti-phage dCTP deaminase [Pseudoalteromonas sp. SCSIO_11900]EWS97870.1 cytidine deaminase [Pseudoalteromonas sp. SCSIO_11900]
MQIENFSNNCEIVIGLVAPVGVNLDDVHNRFVSYFNQFRYEVNYIHLSQVAKEFQGTATGPYTEQSRLDTAMNIGNILRQSSERGDLFALLAINEINKKRLGDTPEPLSRHVHIIRSLKHPDEVETLRQVYGPGFILLGISSSIESRKRYLKDEKGVPEEELERLIERDDKESDSFGQSTRDVFQIADAFVTSDDADSLSTQIGRTLDLLYSKPVVPPTADEYAMFMAYAASLRSADLSRQVGAVLTNQESDILATGANDVPKSGGGLYWPVEGEDKRDYKLGKDSNEEQKNKIILNIMKKFSNSEETTDDELLKEGKKKLKDTGLLDITEYGRAVHAEMEALLSSARNGISTRGTNLYTTTYPCHNCAKHIVASGVKRVLYIEPYPKSFATILHNDSINAEGCPSESEKVLFEPFVGIGPRRFVDLFSMNLSSGRKLKRKENGRLKEWNRRESELRVPMTPLSYLDAEVMLIEQLDEIKKSAKENTND